MIAGLILAGGRGSRLGGRNKALIELSGRTLLALAIARLGSQVDALAISANDPLPPGESAGYDVLPDADPGRPGPLGGIMAGLAWARGRNASHLVSVAVDTPRFPCDLVKRLGGSSDEIAVAASAGRLHPTFALWPVTLLPALEIFVTDEQGRRVMTFIERHPHRVVTFDGDPDPFFNINTEEDLVTVGALR